MEMTLAHRRKTGAFYTPPVWADLAVDYMKLILPLPLESYVYYDPAAGEGALLEALPRGAECYATTLEEEDVEILRSKGFRAEQMDFLDDELDKLPEAVRTAGERLVVFMNPPYFKLPKTHLCQAKTRYQHNDSVALFLYRVLREVEPAFVFMFAKTDLIQAPTMRGLRKDLGLMEGLVRAMFLTPSMSWGLKGHFPIALYAMDTNYYDDMWTSPNLATVQAEGKILSTVFDTTKPKECEFLISMHKALAWHWETRKRRLWAEWERDTEYTAWAIHPFEYEQDPYRYWYTHLDEAERGQILREYKLWHKQKP